MSSVLLSIALFNSERIADTATESKSFVDLTINVLPTVFIVGEAASLMEILARTVEGLISEQLAWDPDRTGKGHLMENPFKFQDQAPQGATNRGYGFNEDGHTVARDPNEFAIHGNGSRTPA